MAIRREEALVLKRSPIRETSLLAVLFSRNAGKIKVLIKGARREKSPLAAAFEPFTQLTVVYYEKLRSDIHLFSEALVVDSNALIRSRLDRFSYGSYFAELVDTFFGIQDPHPDVFDLLGGSLRLLGHFSPKRVARVFEVKLFEQAGLLPSLTHCVLCAETRFEKVFFNPQLGGIVCPKCYRMEGKTIALSRAAVEQLLVFIDRPLYQGVESVLTSDTERELARLSEQFLQFRLEYPLRSSRFLNQVRPLLKI